MFNSTPTLPSLQYSSNIHTMFSPAMFSPAMFSNSTFSNAMLPSKVFTRSVFTGSFFIGALVIFLLLSQKEVDAAPPQISFDTSNVIACLDVSNEEFNNLHPDERLIEARFEVSAMLTTGDRSDLVEFTYQIHSPDRGVQVEDFFPRTELESAYATNITKEEKKEKNATLGLNATGSYDQLVRATGQANMGTKTTVTTRFEKFPEMDVLLASGTIHRNSGVYYKLQATSRTTLLGSKEFTVIFRVPQSWRGSFVHLDSHAKGVKRSVVSSLNDERTIGASHFTVALFLAGDLDAKKSAVRFVDCRQSLLSVVQSQRDVIKKNSYPTTIDKIGNLFALSKPRIPSDWLNQVMASGNLDDYGYRLPPKTRRAAKNYLAARQKLLTLSN